MLSIVFALHSRAALTAPAAAGGTLAQRYERAIKDLEKQRANENATRDERDRLAAEAHFLQQQLVANATRVQEFETAYNETAAQLDQLNAKKAALESDLAKNRDKVGHLLAVLQRLNADAPPALALHPDDSLAAARGAMQLGSTLPPVYTQAAALATQLKDLRDTSAAVEKKAVQAKSQAEALRKARVQLDTLLQRRNSEASAADTKLTEIHGLTEEIARDADDLKGLIQRVAILRAGPASPQGMTLVTPQRALTGELRRGSLRQPVAGTATPGDPAGPGNTPGAAGPGGLWFEAVGGAQAVAPVDSEVVFAGSYQKFGQVLILEIMGGYHLTLAGLARVDVHIGDSVLAGEPVGLLPSGKTGRLYMELRRNGQTIDPGPWMGPDLRKAKGS